MEQNSTWMWVVAVSMGNEWRPKSMESAKVFLSVAAGWTGISTVERKNDVADGMWVREMEGG